MNLLPVTACCALLLAASMPVSPTASAGTMIQRCQSPEGEIIYTDVGCVAVGARSLPMKSELLTRIARDEARANFGNEAWIDPHAWSHAPPPRRPAADGCARSSTQLVMDLQGAVALGDVNRIAESYHWVGVSGSQAPHIMQRLEELGDRSLLQADFFDARIGGGDLQLADAGQATVGGTGGVMQLMFDDGEMRGVVDMDVERYRGCWFVRF